MQGFPSKEEEDAERTQRFAAEEERKKKELLVYQQIAGKGTTGYNFEKKMRQKAEDFKQNELDIMRNDIRALKDAFNGLINRTAHGEPSNTSTNN